jgi:hypothetical protein
MEIGAEKWSVLSEKGVYMYCGDTLYRDIAPFLPWCGPTPSND